LLHPLPELQNVRAVAISPDSQFIVTGASDGTARISDRAGELLHTLAGHTSGIINIAISPDGQFIVTTSLDQTARIWNRAGELQHIIPKDHSDVTGKYNHIALMAITADSTFFLALINYHKTPRIRH